MQGDIIAANYAGDVFVTRKGKTTKLEEAKSYDEEVRLMARELLEDGDSVKTGKDSVISVTGKSRSNKAASLTAFAESEFVLRIGEGQKGKHLKGMELKAGIFSLTPADADVETPLARITNADDRDPYYIIDMTDGMTVVIPGMRLDVKHKITGKTHQTFPPFGGIGLGELVLTQDGTYEKIMEWVDRRVGEVLEYTSKASKSLIVEFKHEEGGMEFTKKRMDESDKSMQQYEYLKTMDVEKLKSAKGVNKAQLELAKTMSEQVKKSGGSQQAFALNMLANMDFEKLKDMPGVTPEQLEQMKKSMPQMKKMQEELKGGKSEQLQAQMALSKKHVELAATDPVLKKNREKMRKEAREGRRSCDLTPYPKPLERYKVK